MGPKYLLFRLLYIFKLKVGIQKLYFPTKPKFINFISLEEWKKNTPPFFFQGKNIDGLKKKPTNILKNNFNDIINGKFIFFNKIKIDLGGSYDWITNPDSGYKYNISQHWSKINDFSSSAGDIKYVWEKARFTFLYDVIMYDYHFEDDQSQFVFNKIEDFIDKNPINKGPNYKCSQEISLRVLNWTFALYYYKDSKNLNEDLFSKIMHSIYWQIHHVYNNINFSRICVRNNHALTETLLVYLSGKLFPFFTNIKKWSKNGKKWFEQEIKYQIYPDGTFLQFSMNYHRVVIQLLTWGIQLSKINRDVFDKIVYERAEKSLHFLDVCSDQLSGKLPNYGLNDGALFFKLNNDDYRNYRSQLDDLRGVLKGYTNYKSNSTYWYGIKAYYKKPKENVELNSFESSGYYIINDGNTKTFIRCGSYKDRPYQSDNLHVDIWVDGLNILRDNGSFKYNTSTSLIEYFNGSGGHNTIGIEDESQMKKGKRFIWYYWIKNSFAEIYKKENKFNFNGKINAFRQIGNNIWHKRKVIKICGKNEWIIEDKLEGVNNKISSQYWHFPVNLKNKLSIKSYDNENKEIRPLLEEKWYSSYYGIKESSLRIKFSSKTNKFITKINFT
tara:strand:- start:408 stop:2243 length:1836 start_codon:yes stop_codon:yes gene_type:complete